jgi:hypothetical protein
MQRGCIDVKKHRNMEYLGDKMVPVDIIQTLGEMKRREVNHIY